MPAQLLSLTAFAKSHGASRQAAAKWRDKGAIVFQGNLVDVAASDKLLRDAGLGRFKPDATTPQLRPATSNRGPVAPRVAPEVAAAIDEVISDFEAAAADDEIDEVIAGDFIEQLLNGQFRNKVQANAIKENALALKHLLAAQKDAGKLVDIDIAVKVIFDDRRAARDTWMAWPARFAPLLAADLDIDGPMLAEALKPYVHQQLEELGEPDLDFSTTDEE